ncbi:MAG: glycerophosphodiester phosphodiesterase [Micropruina sp.]
MGATNHATILIRLPALIGGLIDMAQISRRDLIVGSSAAVGGMIVGGAALGVWTGAMRLPLSQPSPTPTALTYDAWVAKRVAPYYIGHRGAGGVIPEHTLPSYLKALEWGAECVEISVVMSSDGVLYCLHDLTLDRTTTLKGNVKSRTSAELDTARVSIPRLGPRWAGANMPALPRLRDVLEELRDKAVLCIEPKHDAAFPPLVQLIKELKLETSVMLKLDASSPRIAMAKEDGFPVFAYLGNAEVATTEAIAALARRLDPKRDAMVLPAVSGRALMPADLIQRAVGTGVPIWVFPVHRRQEARYYSQLGVEGLIAPCFGYLAEVIPPARSDDFPSGELTPGLLTRDPYANAFALSWLDDGALAVPTPGRQAFVALGQFCPITATSYRVTVDVSFDPLPSDTWQHVSLAFGHTDDRYYEHKLGDTDGYHALLRADGTMGLYAHVEGEPNGQELAKAQMSTPMKSGVWARVNLDVTPDGFVWSRDDGTTLKAKDNRFRGGYLHIGSSATDGTLRLRNLTIS